MHTGMRYNRLTLLPCPQWQLPYSGKIWQALNLAKRAKMSIFHIGEFWNCHRNFAPAAQSAWPEYEHRVLVEEVRSIQAATRIVSRSQLNSHARSESGYARLRQEVSQGWTLLQVSSRMAWCEFLVLPFTSPRTRFTLSALALSTSFLEREESPHMCTVRSCAYY